MARKVIETLAENVTVGQHIIHRDVLKNTWDLEVITNIQNTGDRYAFHYADAVTGQQVSYFVAQRGETINIITED